MSLLGVETFDDVFDGLVGGGLERLVVRSICRRSRGTQAMHAYDTYPPVLVPWELDEVGRRVLRFLAGGRWKGVTRTGWLRLDEADEEEDDVVEKKKTMTMTTRKERMIKVISRRHGMARWRSE